MFFTISTLILRGVRVRDFPLLEGKINKPNVIMRSIGAYICNYWITKGVIVFLDVYTASN